MVSIPPSTTTELDHSLRLRDYQYEMFERSEKGNVIVAMDTGSGKTHVALLRIRTQLERSSGKLMWFLAPTVALCEQQHGTIRENLPALRTRLLIGSDNVDRWGEQRIWDAALDNIQLVVSTYAVLSDALAHGFVHMEKLSLLVFDEAHHCNRGHPANSIMKTFYHPLKAQHDSVSVPQILGLTASPVLRSNINELQRIESNLDALTITPRMHRQQMLRYVHRPALYRLEYRQIQPADLCKSSQPLIYLKATCEDDAGLGPIAFFAVPKPGQWLPIDSRPRSDVQTQILKFFVKAAYICGELGSWAATHFILETIAALRAQEQLKGDLLTKSTDVAALLGLLDRGPLRSMFERWYPEDTFHVSPKVECFLSFLSKHTSDDCSGIVFVQQRVTAAVLCKLLSIHPSTRDRFRCATFVGMANNTAKKYHIAELLDLKAQRETLPGFRARRKNLIIATDALEEGIDVSACNLVLCFSPPTNLKSFIQRRGRARQEKSQFAIMLAADEKSTKIDSWRSLEKSLIEAYQSDMRKVEDLKKVEAEEEAVLGELRSSKAIITPTTSLSHLHHFCACLPHQPYVDLRPVFTFEEDDDTHLITAKVRLPNCLDAGVQSSSGSRGWRTERAAAKDAAFQAYTALYKAGLLNENLLPLSHTMGTESSGKSQEAAASIETDLQFNPWKELADAWSLGGQYRLRITIVQESPAASSEELSVVLTLPSRVPLVPALDLYWTDNSSFNVRFEAMTHEAQPISLDALHISRRITRALIRANHSDHSQDENMDFVAVFSPQVEEGELASWLEEYCGRVPALDYFQAGLNPRGFVRGQPLCGVPHVFHGWNAVYDEQEQRIELIMIPLAKRRNFLKKSVAASPAGLKMRACQAADCTVDLLPLEHARLGMFIPAILQHLEGIITAERLCKTVLEDIPILDVGHVVTAISAPSAGWVSDYQEYEFFGDTVLKFVVSYQLYSEKKSWHEGYLTMERARLVSNYKLAGAALNHGLERFIRTETFKSRKWSAPFISKMKSGSGGTRTLSTKLLADVVEALIGAAYLDGGLDLARKCIHVFLPEISGSTCASPVHGGFDWDCAPTLVREAECLIGRSFKSQIILLEALTHPSCDVNVYTESYQRLEYLGDAVLDMLVTANLASRRNEGLISPGQMTLIKSAVVNAQFLGFLCLDLSVYESSIEIHEKKNGAFEPRTSLRKRHFWQLMRFNAREITRVQSRCLKRYEHAYAEIKRLLEDGDRYPWLQLTRLNPEKFFSDIIESTIGAIFVDSNGSLEECNGFIDRIGLLSYLGRIVEKRIDLSHPKSVLTRVAKTEDVHFHPEVQANTDQDDEPKYSCRVQVSGKDMAVAVDCLSKEEGVIRGALEATEKIKCEVN